MQSQPLGFPCPHLLLPAFHFHSVLDASKFVSSPCIPFFPFPPPLRSSSFSLLIPYSSFYLSLPHTYARLKFLIFSYYFVSLEQSSLNTHIICPFTLEVLYADLLKKTMSDFTILLVYNSLCLLAVYFYLIHFF